LKTKVEIGFLGYDSPVARPHAGQMTPWSSRGAPGREQV